MHRYQTNNLNTNSMLGQNSSRKPQKNAYYNELFSKSRPSYVRQQARLSLEREVARPSTPQTSARTLFEHSSSYEFDDTETSQSKRSSASSTSRDNRSVRQHRPARHFQGRHASRKSSLSKSTTIEDETKLNTTPLDLDSSVCDTEDHSERPTTRRNRNQSYVDDGIAACTHKEQKHIDVRNAVLQEQTRDATLSTNWQAFFTNLVVAQSLLTESKFEVAIQEFEKLAQNADDAIALEKHKSYTDIDEGHVIQRMQAIRTLKQCADLVQCQHDPLLLRVARLLLTLSSDMGTSEPALVSKLTSNTDLSIRLLFKLSKNKALDLEFRTTNTLGTLLNILPVDEGEVDRVPWPSPATGEWPNHHVLLYATATIKFLSSSRSNQRFLVQRATIQRLGYLLTRLTNCIVNTRTLPEFPKLYTQVCYVHVQVLTILRNLALDKKHVTQFQEADIMTPICLIARECSESEEVVHHCSRLLSKLSQHQLGRQLIACNKESPTAIEILLRKGRGSETLVRLCYALGNLMAGNVVNRQLFGTKVIMDTIGQILREWTPKLAKRFDVMNESKISEMESSEFDLVAKVCRCVANLGLDASAAQYLENVEGIHSIPELTRIIALLGESYVNQDHPKENGQEEFMFNTLAAVTNLSYHWKTEEQLAWLIERDMLASITEFLLNGLYAPIDCVHEAIRVLGNFTRVGSVHRKLSQLNADKVVLILIEHHDQGIALDACGVIVNLSCSPSTRERLLENGGSAIRSLLDLFREAVAEFPSLAASICKVFHNAFCHTLTDNGARPDILSAQKELSLTLDGEFSSMGSMSLGEKLQTAIGILDEEEAADDYCESKCTEQNQLAAAC